MSEMQEVGESSVQRGSSQVVDDLDAFIEVLPARVQSFLRSSSNQDDLTEVILDLGRIPQVRYVVDQQLVGEAHVTEDDIVGVVDRVGPFDDDNRAGIERTLHRISVIRNRGGKPIGLTCRVGRAVFGSVRLIDDLVRTGDSILLLGRPGVGKTTMLREVARVLADDVGRRVVVVDTSNEIAGDSDVPHPATGSARRLQVARTELQHRVMIEAVENHMPEVIIIDEMSTELEALAARTIAERGVQLVATAHGNTLANVVANPSLSDLVGGVQAVTLGDVEARRRRTQKTVLERKHEPTFNVVIEIQERNRLGAHLDAGSVVDRMLRGLSAPRELRWLDEDDSVRSGVEDVSKQSHEFRTAPFNLSSQRTPRRQYGAGDLADEAEQGDENGPFAPVRVHPFGVSSPSLEEAINEAGALVELVDDARDADVLVTTKSHYGRRPEEVRNAERDGVPVYVLRRGTGEQIAKFVRRFVSERSSRESFSDGEDRQVRLALEEAEEAISRALNGAQRVELSPQAAYIRRLQHGLAARSNLGSSSTGRDNGRRVVIRGRRRQMRHR